MRLSFRILTLAAAVAAASCGDVARTGRSPVQIVIVNMIAASGSDPTKFTGVLQSDVLTKGSVFNDIGSADLQIQLKEHHENGVEHLPVEGVEQLPVEGEEQQLHETEGAQQLKERT